MTRTAGIALAGALSLLGCGGGAKPGPTPTPAGPTIDVGLSGGYTATVVMAKLMNPSCVSFSPNGELTICDSGNGRVIVF